MRTRLALFVLVLLAAGLGACRQVQCVAQGTRTVLCNALPAPCCPGPDGVVYTEPVYDCACGGNPGIGRGGYGAFRTP